MKIKVSSKKEIQEALIIPDDIKSFVKKSEDLIDSISKSVSFTKLAKTIIKLKEVIKDLNSFNFEIEEASKYEYQITIHDRKREDEKDFKLINFDILRKHNNKIEELSTIYTNTLSNFAAKVRNDVKNYVESEGQSRKQNAIYRSYTTKWIDLKKLNEYLKTDKLILSDMESFGQQSWRHY